MKYLASLFAVVAAAAPSFATHFGISQIVVPVQTVVVAQPVVVQQVHVPVVQAVQVQHVQQVQVQRVVQQQVQCIGSHCGGVQAVRVQSFRQPIVQQRSVVTRSVTRFR